MAILNYSQMLRDGGLTSPDSAREIMRQNQVLKQNDQALQVGGLNLAREQAADEKAKADAIKAQQLEAEAQDWVDNDDPVGFARWSVKNPDWAERVVGVRSGLAEGAKGRLTDTLVGTITASDPQKFMQDRVAQMGGQYDMSDTQSVIDENLPPEEIKRKALMTLAGTNPEMFERLNKAMYGGSGGGNSKIEVYEYYSRLTPDQKAEYDRAQRGEQPTLEEKLNLAKKESDIKVQEAQTKAERSAGVTALQKIAESSRKSRQNLGVINKLTEINESALSGIGANQRTSMLRLAGEFGIPVKGVGDSELLRALSNELVLNKSQAMSGALSNADMQFLRDASPTLSQSAEGRAKLLEYSRQLENRQVEYAKEAQKFRKKKGYFNQSEFEQVFGAENKPLFSTETIESVQPGGEPKKPIDFKNASDEDLLNG